jgi:hypothetical protein
MLTCSVKTIQVSDENPLDPFITVLVGRQGQPFLEKYNCGRGGSVAPPSDALSWVLRGTDVDPDSFITTAPSKSSVSEIDGLAPTRLCDTPVILNIPLGPSIVPLLPEGMSVDFQRHMEGLALQLNFSELRAAIIGLLRSYRGEPVIRERSPGC